MAKNGLVILLLLAVGVLCGCEGAPVLERTQVRSQATISGSFFTESPDEINFPVKILFAIDDSGSMGARVWEEGIGADYYGERLEATRAFINQYYDNENTSYAVMLWNSEVHTSTNGFTRDIGLLNDVLDSAQYTTRTDYLGTLAEIQSTLLEDIVNSNEEARVRSKYIVAFLSDGVPQTAEDVIQDSTLILNSVGEIRDMMDEYAVGSFNFHTFFLRGGFGTTPDDLAAQADAEILLRSMADEGNGEFILFENAEAIDFISVIDFRLTVEYKIKYLLLTNSNSKAGIELLYPDSDGDGLNDAEEGQYGTDPQSRDSDSDGFGDYFEVKVSSPGHILDPLDPTDSNCDPGAIGVDSDNDGLLDCEELIKGTNRLFPDSDFDGIPDGVEFHNGSNPLEENLTLDSDFDGYSDYTEIKWHSNLMSNDPKIIQRYRYVYDIRDAGLLEINQGTEAQSYVRQFNFTISNVDIVDTLGFTDVDGTEWLPGDNIIRMYIAMVPEDRKGNPPIFRVAEFFVNANDASKQIVLTPSDFNLLE